MLFIISCVVFLSIKTIFALDTIQYGAFTQTATYSIANQLGFFIANNLNVVLSIVPNSTFAYAALLDGTYDILTGTIDNAINLRLNSNESLTVLGQLDEGPDIVLASVPSITNITQLEGKSLIVDSPASGYAYLLRRVLSDNGLELGKDYFFQTVGATPIRYADLLTEHLPNGTKVYATILTYPFTSQISSLPSPQKPNMLARISTYISPISSSALTVSQTFLQTNNSNNNNNNSATKTTKTHLLTNFLTSLLSANRFLSNESNANCSILAISKQLNISIETATLEYKAAIDPISGETTAGQEGKFEVDRQAILNVIGVRNQFGGFPSLNNSGSFDFAEAIMPGRGKLIDYRIRERALWELEGFEFVPSC